MPSPTISVRLPYHVPPDRKDRRGRTPLFSVVERGEFDRACAFLAHGHRAVVKDRDGMFLLSFAVHHQRALGSTALVHRLLEHHARLDGTVGAQALVAAAWNGNLDVVQALVARGVAPDVELDQGDNALTAAVGAGHDHVVDWLWTQGVPVENRTPATHRSALLSAVQHLLHDTQVARPAWLARIDRLVAAGADPNRPGQGSVHPTTPIRLAIEHNDLELFDRLAAGPVGLDVHQALRGEQLLGAVMMRPNQRDPASRTMFERTMALQPPLNEGPVTGDDPVLSCALFEQLSGPEKAHRLRALLDAGADPMARGPMDGRFLQQFLNRAFNGQASTAELRDPALLARLAACPTLDVNAGDSDGQFLLLRLASAQGLLPQVEQAARWLLEQGAEVNAVSTDGWTVLSSLVGALPHAVLVTDPCARFLNVLLEQRIDWALGRRPDHEDVCPGGFVAHQAVGRLPAALMERLLQAGMPLDQRDAHGNTPLHRAVLIGQRVNGRLLLAAGASVEALNGRGQRPHEMAIPGDPLSAEVLAVHEQGVLRATMREETGDATPPAPGRTRQRL